MTTTEQRLADALRALYTLVPFDGNHADEMAKGKQLKEAREALAAYDAQQAVPPTCGPIAPGETIGETVDRVLCMGDQFLEDWRESVDDDTARDSDLEEREQEWGVVRPLILQRVNAHYGLVSALREASRALCELDALGEHHDAVLIDDAIAQAGVNHA